MLFTDGLDAAHREEVWDRLCLPMGAEQTNVKLQAWAREVFNGA